MFQTKGKISRYSVDQAHIQFQACDQCDKTFCSYAKLREHQISHGSEKAYVCGTCGKMFQRAHNLRQHEKFVHEGHVTKQNSNKLITCEKCGVEVKERRYRYECVLSQGFTSSLLWWLM